MLTPMNNQASLLSLRESPSLQRNLSLKGLATNGTCQRMRSMANPRGSRSKISTMPNCLRAFGICPSPSRGF